MVCPTVKWFEGTSITARHEADGFAITLNEGQPMAGRRLIMALAVKDTLPIVPGIQDRWGQSVFTAPYCHGYEIEGPLGVVAGLILRHG